MGNITQIVTFGQVLKTLFIYNCDKNDNYGVYLYEVFFILFEVVQYFISFQFFNRTGLRLSSEVCL